MVAIATFDLVDNRAWFDDWLLQFPEERTGDLKGRFVETGYDHKDMIQLLGIGTLVIAGILFVMLLLCLTNPCKKYFDCVERIHQKVSGTIFWSFWLRFLIEDSLTAEVCVCCYLYSSNLSPNIYGSSDVEQLRSLESDSLMQHIGIFHNDTTVDNTFM